MTLIFSYLLRHFMVNTPYIFGKIHVQRSLCCHFYSFVCDVFVFFWQLLSGLFIFGFSMFLSKVYCCCCCFNDYVAWVLWFVGYFPSNLGNCRLLFLQIYFFLYHSVTFSDLWGNISSSLCIYNLSPRKSLLCFLKAPFISVLKFYGPIFKFTNYFFHSLICC